MSVALNYFTDGSVAAACLPLKALLHIMAHGSYEGMDVRDSRFRAMFTREAVLASDWYRERLEVKQQRDISLWRHHFAALEAFRSVGGRSHPAQSISTDTLLATARAQLARVSDRKYLEELSGTIGADPFHLQMPSARESA